MSLLGFVQEYAGEGAEAGHASGAMPFEELPGFTQDHIGDGTYIEVFCGNFDMSNFHFPSFDLFGIQYHGLEGE